MMRFTKANIVPKIRKVKKELWEMFDMTDKTLQAKIESLYPGTKLESPNRDGMLKVLTITILANEFPDIDY